MPRSPLATAQATAPHPARFNRSRMALAAAGALALAGLDVLGWVMRRRRTGR